ncbi:MAG: HAD-IA family hydrolase [Spirochaetaceae bacterium]|jgi:phosphoglycolate phosphatase|nr:HAD-IA family hydrolase [Spirochaetaceae bacterium]
MKFKCLIFDLDGTLVDTLQDIALAMNRALVLRGYPPVPPGEYAALIGWGIRHLAFRVLPAGARDEKNAEALAADAVRFYAERPVTHSRPYPGIPAMVAELKKRRIKTAVLTNKPDPVTALVVKGLFPPGSFDVIRGEKPGVPRKPDPASTWEILTELDRTPRETIFMGDSEIDVETARAADCHALGVSWGFRDRAVLEAAGAGRIIDTPGELLPLMDISM